MVARRKSSGLKLSTPTGFENPDLTSYTENWGEIPGARGKPTQKRDAPFFCREKGDRGMRAVCFYGYLSDERLGGEQ